ncbi:MAG: sel1 repeat family protein [Muribaculaceae bacterium]|nr:sel1 repeat family protein [Muribaculaceae bacterium]
MMRKILPLLVLSVVVWLCASAQFKGSVEANSPRPDVRGPSASLEIVSNRQALRSLVERADSGDMVSIYHLARLYDTGYDSIPCDTIEAMRLYRRAAELNYPPAQNLYGFRLYNGIGGAKDINAGLEWIEKAALNGDPTATNNLGWLLLEGEGVEHDAEKAAFWLTRSAQNGVPSAMILLGDLYREGKGVEKADTAHALSLYNRALERGMRDVWPRIYSMKHQEWSLLPPEEKVAVGMYYYPRLAPEIGVRIFEAAATEGNVKSMALLGDALSRGVGIAYDHAKSTDYLFRAAKGGDPYAAFVIAEMLEMFPDALNGLTDDNDLKDAQSWYEKAAQKGVRTAEEATRNLLNPGYSN